MGGTYMKSKWADFLGFSFTNLDSLLTVPEDIVCLWPSLSADVSSAKEDVILPVKKKKNNNICSECDI